MGALIPCPFRGMLSPDKRKEAAKEVAASISAEAGLAADDAAGQGGAAQDAGSSAGQDVQGSNASSFAASGASASSSTSKPAHQHSWAAVTSQQWVSNSVSVWVQDSAAWDEPVYGGTYWCNKCGCAVASSHNEDMML